jgi:hypothetical protein
MTLIVLVLAAEIPHVVAAEMGRSVLAVPGLDPGIVPTIHAFRRRERGDGEVTKLCF